MVPDHQQKRRLKLKSQKEFSYSLCAEANITAAGLIRGIMESSEDTTVCMNVEKATDGTNQHLHDGQPVAISASVSSPYNY
ncbi:hypothetical protein PHET_05333 [Paragonimus heterotremus]|uniref:Uncharacterized protein n=1 Tax=Paragonimus heterotremus TaxID=100268 RepID=A0A8J4TF26_9TREM|nr:hypothetical protein PHET_05333 [Paragonimus heterotremus]